MHLQSIKYSQFDGQSNEWNLDRLDLLPLNLIVGKNASGKTKTISLIKNLAEILCGKAHPIMFSSANFDAKFVSPEKVFQYKLCIKDHTVVKEEFWIQGDREPLLERSAGGTGKIYAEQEKKRMDFQVDVFMSAFASRRDSIQHPFFEPLYKWASTMRYYRFGTSLGRDKAAYLPKDDSIDSDSEIKNDQMVVAVFKKGEDTFGEPFKEEIKNDMKNVGYNITDLGVMSEKFGLLPLPGMATNLGRSVSLWVKEKDLSSRTEQYEISQGMFRALSLIIQLNYLKMTDEPSCILIDDIGEGLDYERSCALIELIIEKAKKSNFQLIMATNDRFVMNNVPLEYWTILQREGKRCRVFNIQNSREKFEEFRFTGLNNFDFFASNYLLEDHD